MTKVGIITHYYGSSNYGGVLQAYALCNFINSIGFEAEQICYNKKDTVTFRRRIGSLLRSIKKAMHPKVFYYMLKRRKAFLNFRTNIIRHSEKVYTEANLKELATVYDVFITGSDQVWHPNAVCDAYLLDFGITGLKKFSYAASIAKDSLSDNEKKRYKKALKDFSAISVREENAVSIISEISSKDVKWVVDPVFLLDKKEWMKIIKGSCGKDKYIFCYFLGNDINARHLVKRFAEEKGLKIVTLPYLEGEYRVSDSNFGDRLLYDITPEEFLGLIKNAEYVFTDSFHAMAFSLIFEKQYFVFERPSKSSMSSRIESLSKLFNRLDRFCNGHNKTKYEYIENSSPIDYKEVCLDFLKLKAMSIEFLKANLAGK